MKRPRRCEVYVDGASRGNPGPAGVGVVLTDGTSKPACERFWYIGETTNNVAEYLAVVYALQEALQAGYTVVAVKTDSELLVRQMNGQYRVRDMRLRVFHDLARHLVNGFARCEIKHIPRTQNARADRLAGLAVKQRASSVRP